ncbi:cytokine receptor common subunit gamma [Cynoglossus semilaevis]|uniref:Interleukin 2 receptor subunit gamma n=1 Tax=Cynoglossus semilaevis TaxID=244447 RepID=A0A3P8WTP2_CYNSE|nr:cytokine receptor common subunit gamma [Cynoglossus semilaevis]
MRMILFFLLPCLGSVSAKEPPEIDNCSVIHLEYVACSWGNQRPPTVNYTFSSRFSDETFAKCTTYVLENGITTGCNQSYNKLHTRRFDTFETRLTHGNNTFEKKFTLKEKVLLNPPTNITVQNGSDFNLYFYWNQTFTECVESEVRFRANSKKWETSTVSFGKQSYIINLPSSRSRYELQVRSRVHKVCGESFRWSDWSRPAVWGSNNSTDPKAGDPSMSVLTPLFYSLGAFVFVLLLAMLLYHERVRIIPISVVPKPSLVLYDIEDWLQLSKGLKGNFKTNYTERTCTVREYCQVSQSQDDDSVSSSVTTDQTDCSVTVPEDNCEDQTASRSSSASTIVFQSEEKDQLSD